MSVSTDLEEDVINTITEYGDTVTIQKQTGTFDTYDQVTWTDSTTSSTKGIVLPFSAKDGEEWKLMTEGILQANDYICFLKATETIEESVTGTSSQTRTRYLITHNSITYEIVYLKKYKFQDNLVYFKAYIRKLTL